MSDDKSGRRAPATKSKRRSSVAGLAKASAAGVGAGVAIWSRLVDFALIGSGVAAALGVATFAGVMLAHSDHPPGVNGMQYLAIFSQPSHPGRAPEPPQQVAAASTPTPSVDMDPTGAIAPRADFEPGDYELVAAKPDRAWLRVGARILAVHPGDNVPRLGHVSEIAWNDGHWSLIGASGQTLLSSGEAAPPKKLPARPMVLERAP